MSMHATMSLAGSPRSSSCTLYESRSHALRVLQRLDEQRRGGGLLCDLTVATGGQRFPAHRSVLAACSEYFASAVSKPAHHGAVVSLPPEVTTAGFEALLDFAYTSKLLFSKQDVFEVRHAAALLGFRDLDPACFDFLLPKFFRGGDDGRSSAPVPRNRCCNGPKNSNENDAKPVFDSSPDQEVGWLDHQSGISKTGSKKSPSTPNPPSDKQPKETNDYFLQCPKYRKFQLACCTERALDRTAGPSSVLSGHSSHRHEDPSESGVENPGRHDAAVRRGCSMKATAEEQFNTETREWSKSPRSYERGDEEVAEATGNPDEDEGDVKATGNPDEDEGDVEATGNPGDREEREMQAIGRVGAVDLRSHLRNRGSEACSRPGQTAPGLRSHHGHPELSLREDKDSRGTADSFVTEVEVERGAVLPVASLLKAEAERLGGKEEVKHKRVDLCWLEGGRGCSSVEEVPEERGKSEVEVVKHLAERLSAGHPPSPPPSSCNYPDTGRSSLDYPDTGRSSLDYPDTGRSSLVHPDTGRSSLDYPDTGRPLLDYPNTGRSSLDYPNTGRSSLDYPDTGRPLLDRLPLPVHLSIGSTCCPFLGPAESRRQVADGAEVRESAGMSRPPCTSPFNSMEEADSESETEGDESYALETAQQVPLPFSVDRAVDLSKADFQQLLKTQPLTAEQLEFVHDLRRRSKNRMAARRCRKRKLDCIYDLECEIHKLRAEQQRMLAEHGRLQQLKAKSWCSVSSLCRRICAEASLLPEQLQVLAKYSVSDCPLASLIIPHLDTALPAGHTPPPEAQASLSACAPHLDADEACPVRWSNLRGDIGGEQETSEEARTHEDINTTVLGGQRPLKTSAQPSLEDSDL